MKTVGRSLVVLLSLGVLLALGSPAHAIGVYQAGLDPGMSLGHPAQSWPGQPTFSIFTYPDSESRAQALNLAGFNQDDPVRQTMASSFAFGGSSGFSGVLKSEVWQYTGLSGGGDGHLLFLYQVVNTSAGGSPGQNDFHAVSVFGGHWADHDIIDTGLIRTGSAAAYLSGDLFTIFRPAADVQLGVLARPYPVDFISPGESSAWFYFETDALQFSFGDGQVNGNQVSVTGIPTFAPAPEPITVLALASGLIGLGGYIRRRNSSPR